MLANQMTAFDEDCFRALVHNNRSSEFDFLFGSDFHSADLLCFRNIWRDKFSFRQKFFYKNFKRIFPHERSTLRSSEGRIDHSNKMMLRNKICNEIARLSIIDHSSLYEFHWN